MIKNEIEMNAGRIRQHLNATGESSFDLLKDKLEITVQELNLALGWLARENNIGFSEKDGGIIVFVIF